MKKYKVQLILDAQQLMANDHFYEALSNVIQFLGDFVNDVPETDFGNIAGSRKWQGLTDEEMLDCLLQDNEKLASLPLGAKLYAQAIERALREKNNG